MLLNIAVAKVYEAEQTTITIIVCAPLNLMEDIHPCPGLAANNYRALLFRWKEAATNSSWIYLPLYAG